MKLSKTLKVTQLNRIETLLEELCPTGVPFFKLGEIGTLENNGVDKKILPGETEVKLLNYMDISKSRKIFSANLSMMTTASSKKITQCNLLVGDVFITPSSETREDLAKASEIMENIPNAVYSYHIMRIRLNDLKKVNPTFLVYLFESNFVQEQIMRLSTGMTRYGLTKPKWESLLLPIPDIQIQNEIIKIFAQFSELQLSLNEELEARNKQFSYYLDEILFRNSKSQMVVLSTICEIGDGLHGTPLYEESSDYYFINGNNLVDGRVLVTPNTKRVSRITFEKYQSNIVTDNTIFLSINGTVGNLAIFKGEQVVLGKSVAFFTVNREKLLPKYLYYILQSYPSKQYFAKELTGSTIKNLGLKSLRNMQINLPALSKQIEIVRSLESMENLLLNVEFGLPAELEARRMQYEYYREKLLTFKELESA